MKHWTRSRLVQLGVLTFASAAVDALATGLTWRQAVVAGVGALVVALRAVTKQPLHRGRVPRKTAE